MSKILKFMVMDSISVKTEIKPMQGILVVLLSVFGYFSMGIYGIVLGLVPLINLLIMAAFAMGDNGLDSLYVTLFISRKTVVAGRYIYILALKFLIVGIYFVAVAVASSILGYDLSATSLLAMIMGMFIMTSLINSITIPFMFKVGFRQAKSVINMIPLVMMGVIILVMRLAPGESYAIIENMSGGISGFIFGANAFVSVFAVILLWAAVMMASCLVALKFYSKRSL